MAEESQHRLPGRMFTCPVCLDLFKNPKVLSCGHSFCLDPCLTQVTDNENFLKCPECRVATQIPSDGLQSLPTNFSLLRAIDEGTTFTPGRNVCGEHCKAFRLKCYTCNKDICPDCLEDGHSCAEHDTEASRVSDVIEPVRSTLDDFHRMMREKLAAVIDAQNSAEQKWIKTAESIERSAELAINNVQEMKNTMLTNLNEVSEADKQQMEVEKVNYETLMQNADELRQKVHMLAEAVDSGQLERLDEWKSLERAVVTLYKDVIPAYERAIPKRSKIAVFIPKDFTASIGDLKILPRPPPREPPVPQVKEY